MLDIGAAKTEITPDRGVRLAGYRARAATAEGAHDPLFSRAIALDDGERGFVLVALDILAVDEALVAAIRRETVSHLDRLRESDVVVCATHTHAGPGGIFSGQADYDRELAGRIVRESAKAAAAAWESRRPGRLGLSACEIHGVACNREEPPRASDTLLSGPLLRVMKLEDASGNPVACVINYACHPTVLDAGNLLFSRDWPGYAEDMMESSGCPVGMVVFLNGAAADVSTRYTRRASTFREAERLGRIVAEGALSAAGRVEYASPRKISVSSRRLSLPGKPSVSPESAVQALARARQELVSLRDRADVSPGEIRRAESAVLAQEIVLERSRARGEEHHAAAAMNSAGLGDRLAAELCVVDVQDAVMVFVPGEATARVGERVTQRVSEVRRLGADRIWFVGYANGHVGYIVDAEAWGKASSSYEALMSRVAPQAAGLIEEEVANLMVKGMSDGC
ncbi:MAG: neutral/alkaline non-lysosomal ceramidase N-terminal domain-containing protein [Bacteroidota bacterium]